MPLAVEVGGISDLGRKDFNLPEDACLFCFSFDLNSSIHRKNPRACLKAFQKAFPVDEVTERPVGLVIKCHKPKRANEQWDRLKEAAERDHRIFIVEETLSRPDLLALYKSCDCYLSLHRAEGFGRGMAEALLPGLEVIATGYSGNVDHCRGNPAAHLVDYKLVPVKKDEYPYGEGQCWAEAARGYGPFRGKAIPSSLSIWAMAALFVTNLYTENIPKTSPPISRLERGTGCAIRGLSPLS